MRRLAAAWAALVIVALVACGDDQTAAEKALDDTEDKLSDVRSGRLELELLASPSGAAEGRGSGFRIEGPFETGKDEGDLPVADLEYTRITGTRRRTTGFISTGDKAFVELDGKVYELESEQVNDLRVTDSDGDAGLEGLSFEDWVTNPKVEAGPRVDGVATERITGDLDAVPAINDLLALAGDFGADDDAPSRLEGVGADHVRRAVRRTSVEILTGKEDRLLRRLDLVIELSVKDNEPQLRRALKGLAGAVLRLDLDVTDMNADIRVPAPKDARPASELPEQEE